MKLATLDEALQDKVELQKAKEVLLKIPIIELCKSKILTILLLQNGSDTSIPS